MIIRPLYDDNYLQPNYLQLIMLELTKLKMSKSHMPRFKRVQHGIESYPLDELYSVYILATELNGYLFESLHHQGDYRLE